MDFRVEPSPSGGYVVRAPGADAPIARHDTEEEAHEWVARHAAAAAGADAGAARPAAASPPGLPRFAGLPDGTQVLLRLPRASDGGRARTSRAVAEIPSIGTVAGGIDGACVWTTEGWSGGALEALLRGLVESAQED